MCWGPTSGVFIKPNRHEESHPLFPWIPTEGTEEMDPFLVDIIRSAVHEWVTPRVRLPLWYHYGGHPT